MNSMLFATKNQKTMDGWISSSPQVNNYTLYRGPPKVGLFPLQIWPFHGEKNMGVHFPPEKGVFCESAKPRFKLMSFPRKSPGIRFFLTGKDAKNIKTFKKGILEGIIGMNLSIH